MLKLHMSMVHVDWLREQLIQYPPLGIYIPQSMVSAEDALDVITYLCPGNAGALV